MTDLAVVDTDAEWHAWRRGGVGGSDIPAILGLSAYASPVSLYYQKVGVLDHSAESDTQRQRIGKRMEKVLAEEFHDITGLHVIGEQRRCEMPGHEFARCTTDGGAGESPNTHWLDAYGTVQMKTDGRFGWPDGPPANIRAQCIWEMGVTRLRYCWLIVMFAGFRVEVFEIPWDDDAQASWDFMFTKAQDFWLQHVLAEVVPPIDEHDATTRALTELYPDPDGLIDIDEEGRVLVTAAQYAARRTKAAEAEEDRVRNRLRAYLGDRTDLVDGWTEPGPRSTKGPQPVVVASWRPSSTRRFELDLFRIEHPALAEQYLKETPTRTLRVTKLKESTE